LSAIFFIFKYVVISTDGNTSEYSMNWCALFVLLYDQQLKFNIFQNYCNLQNNAVPVENLSGDTKRAHEELYNVACAK